MTHRRYAGCCGAYCKTCKPFVSGACKGCKIGFDTGERDISKAKCKIKLCCFRDRQLDTCADCADLENCETIAGWYAKNGYKYKKYKEAVYFIRDHGYEEFLNIAGTWNNAYGKMGKST